jgi:thiol-disulfide isomerase/thioredoxin
MIKVPLVFSFMVAVSLTKGAIGFGIRSSTHHARNALFVGRNFASVTGIIYEAKDNIAKFPTVKLFTKEGCTLCDKVKEILVEVNEKYPHTLMQIDITDEDHQAWFSKYKYDIPVLHLEDKFWIKHRTTSQEIIEGFAQARDGTFEERQGDPDAGAMERRQAERAGG